MLDVSTLCVHGLVIVIALFVVHVSVCAFIIISCVRIYVRLTFGIRYRFMGRIRLSSNIAMRFSMCNRIRII